MTRFLVLCMVCAFAPAFAQPPVHTLKGRVVDGETGLPLSDVRLFVHETEAGTLSDSLGRFVLSGLAAGRHHLHVERIGYRADAFY
ncbi:MAG: carboxypeptidase regulatory-like domain-containing protein, partial [Bacteroidota bacterium]